MTKSGAVVTKSGAVVTKSGNGRDKKRKQSQKEMNNMELEIEHTENMMIKMDNALLEQNMHFTAREKDIFMLLCSVLKEKGTDTFDISFRDIKKAINQRKISNEKLSEIMESMGHKLLHSTGKLKTSKGFDLFVLFTTMKVDKEDGVVTISVNPEYSYLLNDLIDNYTSSDFLAYLSLKSKYTKDLYFWLLRWKYSGKFIVKETTLRQILNIPEDYKSNAIKRRVLTPALSELSEFFHNLQMEEVRKVPKGGGTPIVEQYIFTFTHFDRTEYIEKHVAICPVCGRRMIAKEMNHRMVYCHADGAYKDAPCRKVYEDFEMDQMVLDRITEYVTVKVPL